MIGQSWFMIEEINLRRRTIYAGKISRLAWAQNAEGRAGPDACPHRP